YRQQLFAAKLPVIMNEIEKSLDADEPIVVWTWHKSSAETIAEKLGDRALLMHGEISADQREERMAQWKSSKETKALVSTMVLGQVAIDLSHAHLGLFAELDWTPAIIGQAEMRTFDSTRSMNITFVVANHWVDHKIAKTLITKLNASSPLGLEAAGDAIRE